MERNELRAIIESLIFVAEEPIGEQTILKLLEPDGVERDEMRETIEEIKASWNENPARGLKLMDVAGGYQFRTKESTADWVKRLYTERPAKLSPAAMETLAIIAYRQPIVRAEIEHVRGVDSGGVLKKLLERRLIRIVGKRDEPGQPLIYGTTKEFLELFELNSLKDMPPLADLKELAQRHMEGRSEDAPERDSEKKQIEEDDDEEPTLAIREDDDEEATEIISRLEEDENDDKQALANLEVNLKQLRRLEKSIFPKPEPAPEQAAEGAEHAKTDEGAAQPSESGEAPGQKAEPAEQNAPEQTDRPVE